MTRSLRTALRLLLPLALVACSTGQPVPDATVGTVREPATIETTVAELAERYRGQGTGESILFWTEFERRAGFGHIAEIYPTRRVEAGPRPYPLPAASRDLTGVRYTVDDVTYSLEDFLALPDSIGLIVVQDSAVLFEDYAAGHGPDIPWMSFSVTKSITSMLIGAAIHDGYIAGVGDPVTAYLPRLSGTAYDGATVEDILQMASGVAWNEDYRDETSDVSQAGGANGIRLYRYMADLPRASAAGETFNYNTGESNLAGALLRAAIGNNASSYLERKIWRPFGMEHDAFWVVTPDSDAELGGCCLNATLRDYARIGLFALNDGVLPDGTRVLPEGWMARSVAPSDSYEHYGYLWWVSGTGTFSARGIFGQVIFIDPSNDLVIAMHGNASQATGSGYGDHIQGVIRGIVAALSR